MGDLFDTPSVDEIRDDMLRGVQAERPDWPVGPGSLTRAEYGSFAEGVGGLHAHMDVLECSVTPLDADEAGLVVWGEALDVPRKAGAQSSAAQCLLVTSSTPAAAIPAGTLYESAEGLEYEVANPAVVAGDGTVTMDLFAVLPGAGGDLVAGEQLTIKVGIPGLASAGTLIRDLVDGTNEETLGAWRARQLAVWRDKRGGGTSSDYQQWALELEFVDRAYVYARKPTISSVGVAALRAGELPVLSASQEAELLVLLNERRPVTDDVYVVQIITRRVDVDILVSLLPSEVLDWTEPGGGLTAASFDPVTGTLTTNEPLPSNLGPGDLLTLVEGAPSTTATGEPVRVSAVTGGTTLVVAPLTDGSPAPFPFTVAPGAVVRPSSALLAEVRQQVLDGAQLCEDFTLAGLRSVGPANPARKYGAWQSDYVESEIAAVATVQPGIVSATVTLGSSGEAVEFAFPNDDTVELLLPGEVVVRG